MDMFVGIDVSKDRLDVHIRPVGEAFAVERSGRDLEQLVERLRALSPELVAVEATGGYETIVAAAVAGSGLPLAVVNPAHVRNFAQALGKRAKTDRIDAAVIAHFAQAIEPEPRPLASEAQQTLAELVGRRRQIVEMLAAERQREKRASHPRVRKSLARHITLLEKELVEVDGDIDGLIRGSAVWRDKEDLLASVLGIGKTLARALIADLPELGQLDRRRIASLAGLAPFTRQSGRWRGKSKIGGGRATVRSALFIAAMVASRYQPNLKACYQRLLKAGKPKMVALIAIARKILTILNAIIRTNQPFKPELTCQNA
jgi:transposase